MAHPDTIETILLIEQGEGRDLFNPSISLPLTFSVSLYRQEQSKVNISSLNDCVQALLVF